MNKLRKSKLVIYFFEITLWLLQRPVASIVAPSLDFRPDSPPSTSQSLAISQTVNDYSDDDFIKNYSDQNELPQVSPPPYKLDFDSQHPTIDDNLIRSQPEVYVKFPDESIVETGTPDYSFLLNSLERAADDGFKLIKNITQLFRKFFSTNINSIEANQPQETSFRDKTTSKGLDLNIPFSKTIFNGLHDRVSTIYPGTIWCGMGNFAPNDYTIGLFFLTDLCCRQHDKCPDSIPKNGEKHGLTNTGRFTRSHCECDRKFFNCLKTANTFISNKIGSGYFNILRPQCFRKEYPIIHCLKWFDNKCLTYLVDETKNQTWQWFDNKVF